MVSSVLCRLYGQVGFYLLRSWQLKLSSNQIHWCCCCYLSQPEKSFHSQSYKQRLIVDGRNEGSHGHRWYSTHGIFWWKNNIFWDIWRSFTQGISELYSNNMDIKTLALWWGCWRSCNKVFTGHWSSRLISNSSGETRLREVPWVTVKIDILPRISRLSFISPVWISIKFFIRGMIFKSIRYRMSWKSKFSELSIRETFRNISLKICPVYWEIDA